MGSESPSPSPACGKSLRASPPRAPTTSIWSRPTHFALPILQALAKPLPIPVVWNSGGYDSVSTLRLFEGKVQIYLPDLKYADSGLARRCSGVEDYFEVARAAIEEMVRQTGPCVQDEKGLLRRGVLIRHLMLPGQLRNTKAVIDFVAGAFPPGTVWFSLMSQYLPMGRAEELGLNRRVTPGEYRAAVSYLQNCGIQAGYLQEPEASSAAYIPPFDLEGV